jgi:hypothetical protein
MAQRRFMPAQGDPVGLSHYFELVGDFADRVGVATPMLDRAAELFYRCIDMGLGEHDNAVMVDVIGKMPRGRAKTKAKPKARPAKKKKSKVGAKKTKEVKRTVRKQKSRR